MAEMSGKVTLTTKQANALDALLNGETVNGAAAAAGVSERQVYRWLKDDAFNSEMKRMKAEMLRLAGVRLAALTARSIKVLGELLEDPHAPGAGVRLRCAIAVLEMVDRWRQTDDFDERLTRLERQTMSWY